MILKDAVDHDRKVRRKMSRRLYAETVGIKEGRVHALEHGRAIKPGEMELLAPFIGDLLEAENVDSLLDREATPTGQPSEAEIDANAQRTVLGNAYLNVLNRLGSRIPPYPWPSQFRLETVPPVEFPAIREWIDQVDAWVTEQDGDVPPAPNLEGTDNGVDLDPDPDFDEWEDVAPPTEPEPNPFPEPEEPEPPVQVQPFDFGDVESVVPDIERVDLDPALTYVTNGELKSWKWCQRNWYLSSFLQLGQPVRKVTGPAAVGTRFHAPLAAWYRPKPADPWYVFNQSVQDDREYLQDVGASDETMKQFDTEVDLVRAMLEGYFQWVQETSADIGMKVLEPEAIISVDPQFPQFPNHRLLAKLDVRYEDERDGSRRFLDHKTVTGFVEAVKTLQLDEQMLHYTLIEYLKVVEAGLAQDVRVAGATYNMARKVKRTAQASAPFYMREPVEFNNDQLMSYWRRVQETIRQIEAARARLMAGEDHRDVVPPNPTRDCSWKCEYFALCPMMDHSPNGARIYMQEQLVYVNPLQRYEPEAVGETM